MKTNCSIIRDLLPLYTDEVCSEESKELVEKHLEECEDCRKELRLMAQSFEIQKAEITEKAVAKASDSAWKKRKRKSFFSGIMVVLVIFGIGLGVFLGSHFFTSADKNNVEALKKEAGSYFKVDTVFSADLTEQGDYIAMRFTTVDKQTYLCIFERDSVFKNRFTAAGGTPNFEKGKLADYHFSEGEISLHAFCASGLSEKVKYYTFQNSGITYTCPVKNGNVLDLFVIPFSYDADGTISKGNDLNSGAVLLDSQMRKIKN